MAYKKKILLKLAKTSRVLRPRPAFIYRVPHKRLRTKFFVSAPRRPQSRFQPSWTTASCVDLEIKASPRVGFEPTTSLVSDGRQSTTELQRPICRGFGF